MKVFIVVSSLLAVATAAPSVLTQQVYATIPATTYIAAPAEVTSQFHAQDELGQYSYGYSGGLSAKTETKSLDGVTRGSYTFLDADNKVQTVSYTADAANGFRAEASNLPVAPVETRAAPEPVQDTPEVAQAKVEHLAAVEEVKARNSAADEADAAEPASVVVNSAPVAAITPITTYNAAVPTIAYAPASGFSYSTSTVSLKPQPVAISTYAAPIAAPTVEVKAPASFAYSTYTHNIPTAAIQYSAAPVTTYAVNVPAPSYAYAYSAPAYYTSANFAPLIVNARSAPVAVPEPVQDTPEVAQAKAEHLQAVAEAKARNLQ
ncbi:cuticle protein 19.8-like [Topomyia yanbarensis]|uniref:cuticle protein 19.8-like n=1 Tax=Topomyia yanbarensis TaxID=2498891 RepID=UPI00273B603E|nr:cuticle protein 19.8-like [Topomyia yanbarensis]